MRAERLLHWYRENKRDLPWRRGATPYGIWVSEVMLQQTQVDRVVPYYGRWMGRFPDACSLASAPVEEVLLYWEGLGYYARARNLHAAAAVVCGKFGGELPRDRVELQKLPGTGPYTSAAVMSIAFGEAIPAVDANAARVCSRLDDIHEPPKSPGGRRRILQAATGLLAGGPPGELTQAVMELGALVCRPWSPECRNCPLAGDCEAFRKGSQSQLPVREKEKGIVHVSSAAAVVVAYRRALLYMRPPESLWGGLQGFPAEELREGERVEEAAARAARESFGLAVIPCAELCVVHHSYTNRKVVLHGIQCRLAGGTGPCAKSCHWVPLQSLDRHPLDAGSRKIAEILQKVSC